VYSNPQACWEGGGENIDTHITQPQACWEGGGENIDTHTAKGQIPTLHTQGNRYPDYTPMGEQIPTRKGTGKGNRYPHYTPMADTHITHPRAKGTDTTHGQREQIPPTGKGNRYPHYTPMGMPHAGQTLGMLRPPTLHTHTVQNTGPSSGSASSPSPNALALVP
jgi:hypothetical protein